MNQPTFAIQFRGMESFDTLEDANRFKERLGDRYKATQKCEYPDVTFFVVYFDDTHDSALQLSDINTGDRLMWIVDEFDSVRPELIPCVVENIYSDYAIAKTEDGLSLFIDNDTIYQFKKGERACQRL